MSTTNGKEKGHEEKQAAADEPGKDDVHEQREPDQEKEGVIGGSSKPAKPSPPQR